MHVAEAFGDRHDCWMRLYLRERAPERLGRQRPGGKGRRASADRRSSAEPRQRLGAEFAAQGEGADRRQRDCDAPTLDEQADHE